MTMKTFHINIIPVYELFCQNFSLNFGVLELPGLVSELEANVLGIFHFPPHLYIMKYAHFVCACSLQQLLTHSHLFSHHVTKVQVVHIYQTLTTNLKHLDVIVGMMVVFCMVFAH